MSRKIKGSVLDKFIANILFEDNAPSFTQISADDNVEPDINDDGTTVPSELPIGSSEQMAVQLSVQSPPVEDPDYKPVNSTDLSYAAEAIARMVPDEQAQWYYDELHRLLDLANERNETVVAEDGEYDINLESFSLKIKDIVGILIEQSEDDSEPSAGMSFDDMASKLGYSSPTGPRQDLERIISRMGFTAEKILPEDLQALQDFAVHEFINHLSSMDLIDPEDVEDLRASPNQVMDLDSFRFFFVSGFMLPAFREIMKNARKRVEAEIDKLGVPIKTRQTIMNQAFGDTPRSNSKLMKKLYKDADKEGMSVDAADESMARVKDAFPMLQSLASVEGDLVSGAMSIWQRSGKSKKERVISQALASMGSFQEEE